MKVIYFFAIALLYSSTIKAQIIPINEPIELDTNISCTMKVTDDVNRMYIPPRDEVKEVLAGRVDGCATINVNYNNFPVNVINPSQDGPEKAAFQFAIDIWESLLDSPVTININANWTNLGGSTLGSAGAAFKAEATLESLAITPEALKILYHETIELYAIPCISPSPLSHLIKQPTPDP